MSTIVIGLMAGLAAMALLGLMVIVSTVSLICFKQSLEKERVSGSAETGKIETY